MIIIEDTREQDSLCFSHPDIEMVALAKLEYGDYSCHHNGQSCPIFFERKGLGDLFQTLTTNYPRFKNEINRCVADRNKLVIIVEKPLSYILKGYKYSMVKGASIIKTLFTLMVRYHIPFVCCSSRDEMATYISEFYHAWAKHLDTTTSTEQK